jgi:hypothetical protein
MTALSYAADLGAKNQKHGKKSGWHKSQPIHF